MKLNGLLALYTSCPTAPTRYLVLLQLLKFAQQSKQLATLLVPVIKVCVASEVCDSAMLLCDDTPPAIAVGVVDAVLRSGCQTVGINTQLPAKQQSCV